ncbi:MAG: type IX secretion system membrane protein PorP/SprF [Bacteroidia bacterium]|nr:type IX secretion system membrane protein PorP/SprF [Bacteroidia bacterium]
MKKALSSGILLFILSTAFAQQDPQYSQNMFNTPAINPGAAGSGDRICAYALIREQWMGLAGHPSTKVFNINAPLTQLESVPSAVGLTIVTDNIGFEKNLALNLTYAYLMKIGRGKLGLGLNLGLFNKALVNTDWTTGGANSTPSSDPLIPNDESAMAFNFDLGAYYRTDKFYLGVSSTHLNEPTLDLTKAKVYMTRHYYFTTGYNIQMPNPLFQVIPSAFIQSDGSVTQMNFNMNLLYDNKFWGGVSYRVGDAYTAMIGMELVNGIKIGMAYDFTTSDIGTYSSGAFEAFVGYCFQISREQGKTKSEWILNWKH